jgi:hypothetical protein
MLAPGPARPVRWIAAEAVPNLCRETVQLLILADVELRQQVYQVEDVGHQRRMEAGFRFVEPVGKWLTTLWSRLHRSSVPFSSD